MEYLFKNYKGRNKEKLVQIARISVIIFTCVFCLMFRENNNLFNPGDYAVTIVDSDEYKIIETANINSYMLTANAGDGTIPATSGWTIASGSKTATKSVNYNATYGTRYSYGSRP